MARIDQEYFSYDERQLLLQCINSLEMENAELRAIIKEDQKLKCTVVQNIWEKYWKRCQDSLWGRLRMFMVYATGEYAARKEFLYEIGERM